MIVVSSVVRLAGDGSESAYGHRLILATPRIAGQDGPAVANARGAVGIAPRHRTEVSGLA